MATNEVSILKFGSTEYSVKDDTGTASNHKHTKSQITDFPDISGKADLADIAPAFSESVAYGIGDYVTYEGDVYRFKMTKSVGTWNTLRVTKITAVGQYVTAGKKANTALGTKATAEGSDNTASAAQAHAEGYNTTASGNSAHAEGNATEATGDGSHAEGYATKATGAYSHAEGTSTEANSNYSHAGGYVDRKGYIKTENSGDPQTGTISATGAFAHGYAVGDGTNNNSAGIKATNTGAIALGSVDRGFIEASGEGSLAGGSNYPGDTSHIKASGKGSFAHGMTYDYDIIASGEGAVAVGYACSDGDITASGEGSFAGGYGDNTASGVASFSFGYETYATNNYAVAMGNSVTASGESSHAEGSSTVASGDNSHAGGYATIAQRASQTVIGEFNEADTGSQAYDKGDYAFIIGNGTGNNARSNALTVDWSGNLEAAGNVIAKGKIKVSNGTSGNLAGFDTNGYIIDSGSKASDFAASSHMHTKSQITDFPTLGTAAAKDVAASGNASTTQVVMGNDSRLSDARTPTSHTHTKSQITDFPSSMTPTSHASSATTYGTGTTSNYGHVKLATGDMNGASNVNGVACSKNHTHSQYLTSITTDQSISAHPASVETEFSRYMVLKNGVKLCWGNRVINQDDDSSYELYTTFPITFSSKPTVFLCPHVDSESSYLIASIGNDISTSGFWIKKHAKYPGVFKFSEGSPDVYWFAIGV